MRNTKRMFYTLCYFLAKTYYDKSFEVLQEISQITDKLLRISGQSRTIQGIIALVSTD